MLELDWLFFLNDWNNNFNLEDVAIQNLEKLKLRAAKGKISGSGDDR